MAGWDEGNVYYTDLGDGDGRPGWDGECVTPGQARRKFTDFLRNFRSEPTAEYPDGRLVYRDKLDQDTPPRDVTVLLDDTGNAVVKNTGPHIMEKTFNF